MAATNNEDLKKGFITDVTDYSKCMIDIYKEINCLLASPNRFMPINDREEKSVFDIELIKKVSKGKYATRWRGISMMKDTFDMTIYEQLLWEIKPKTIFETGTYTGACALWMADVMKMYDLPVQIYSIDISLDLVDPQINTCKNISIKKIDVKKINQVFSGEFLKTCPHPWIISEDCHVDVIGVMEHFHHYMCKGDYFVIEDTSPDTPLTSGQGLLQQQYEQWGTRKLTLMKEFLKKYNEFYRVDTFYTDYFGYNGTFNWDGYIKRIKD
ncbi:rhamnosyl O-methyltransferase isoform X1 [Hydra vulgaris]|uniref:rhamnosyl O-methyltransferase isoform X1 n=1 Tax=Hydra vulgaris TaxID=6087 RepID=UPI000641133B|nr:rhamnosyl O-methyltransferase [Hydra vulgaris]XP_047141839.1 rhamnosyl O-methyltransferase [Hydra vulgaris]